MPFKEAFIALVPDAVAERHRCVVETDLYRLAVVLVSDANEAVEICRELVQTDGVQSLALCPGFTHEDVGRIVAAVGDGIAVAVARGDGRSADLLNEGLRRAGWF